MSMNSKRHATSKNSPPSDVSVAATPVEIHNFIRLAYQTGRRQKSVSIADDADNIGCQKPRIIYSEIEAGKGTKNEQRTKRRGQQK
jgi:hypothetical protein